MKIHLNRSNYTDSEAANQEKVSTNIVLVAKLLKIHNFLPVANQRRAQNRWTFQKDQILQTVMEKDNIINIEH